MGRARVVGINHVALEIGDVDEALDFYGRLFDFVVRERSEAHALIAWATRFSRCSGATALQELEEAGLAPGDGS